MMVRKQVCIIFAMLTGLVLAAGCRSIRPYEKEYLVHPTMDDSRVERLSGPYGKSIRPAERLGSLAGSSGSTSCPTCGG